ncbi:rRNA small subunit methyltransferase 1 [Candidatus Roizmanbacteria bacterium]|nr:rRNA small subunit methyltransferase 1 [Candidatus Roizmanbacteria bacterium]
MLYIVGTPIGNLNDLTYRQARTIAAAEIILAEDTRSAGILLEKITQTYPVSRPASRRVISYYKEREFEKLPEILNWLAEEKEVVLISESGMPTICDPGNLLIQTVIKRKLPFTVVPGPTAVMTAVVCSGFPGKQVFFLGFLPKRAGELRKLLDKVLKIKQIAPATIFVAYESPFRCKMTLTIIGELIPQAEVCLCREMTKKFEEVIRGKAIELKTRDYKGEITLVFQ